MNLFNKNDLHEKAAEAAADKAPNADATKVEACVTTTAEAHTALTLVQAAIASSCLADSIMAARAAANNARMQMQQNWRHR